MAETDTARRIVDERKARGWNQRQLAERAGVALALAATACGGDGQPVATVTVTPSTSSSAPEVTTSAPAPTTAAPTPSPADTDRAALEAAVRAYSRAFLTGRAREAHALLSKRCQARLSLDAMTTITAQARDTYGDLPVRTLHVDALAGDLARVTYTFAVPALTQTGEPWVREGGRWHEDDC